VFGLTCSRYQSGEIDWSGRISRCGDEMMRVMLYEAAQSMLALVPIPKRSTSPRATSTLKWWIV
jgi:transposase